MAGTMTSDDSSGAEYWKWAGLGFEFTGVVGLFFYFGYLADEHWGCKPWGLLTGGAIGVVGGIYWLVKEGYKMMAELEESFSAKHAGEDAKPSDQKRSNDNGGAESGA